MSPAQKENGDLAGPASSELRRRPLTAQHQPSLFISVHGEFSDSDILDFLMSWSLTFDEERETAHQHARVVSAVKRMPTVLCER